MELVVFDDIRVHVHHLLIFILSVTQITVWRRILVLINVAKAFSEAESLIVFQYVAQYCGVTIFRFDFLDFEL